MCVCFRGKSEYEKALEKRTLIKASVMLYLGQDGETQARCHIAERYLTQFNFRSYWFALSNVYRTRSASLEKEVAPMTALTSSTFESIQSSSWSSGCII